MQCSCSLFERINRQDKEKKRQYLSIYLFKQETTAYYADVPSSGRALKLLIIK